MIGRNIIVGLAAVALSVAAAGQCINGENAPVDSRTRRLLAPDGKVISGAEITVSDASRKVLFRTHSDSHGKFSIPHLKTPDYRWLNDKNFRVEIAARGYVRHCYVLLPSNNSRRVLPLNLVPTSASLCNDMRVVDE